MDNLRNQLTYLLYSGQNIAYEIFAAIDNSDVCNFIFENNNGANS